MDFETFKTDALRTESRPEHLNYNLGALAQLLRCGVEMAKIMDTAKKTMFYGKPLDVDLFRDQIASLQERLMLMSNRAHRAAHSEDSALFPPNLRIAHGAIGMFGESGELLEAVLKQIVNGQLDLVNVGEEIGDAFWYAAIIADETGVSFDRAQETVVEKLKKRYGDKFTADAALVRDIAGERAVLEKSLSAETSN